MKSIATTITVVWLYLCCVQWTAEATYDLELYSFVPLIHHFRPPEPFCPPKPNIPYSVVSFFDMNGIRGNISFRQNRRSDPVQVVVQLDGLDQFGEDERWGWHIHEYPINFAQLEEFPCTTNLIGGHFDPDNRASNPNYATECSPNNASVCELGDLAGRFGPLRPDQSTYTFEFQERRFNLYGHDTFVGRSIVIHRTDGFRWACANIGYDGHNSLQTLIARFPKNPKQHMNTLQGDVVLRRSTKRTGVSLFGTLYRVDGGPVDTTHQWSLRPGSCDSITDATPVYGTLTRNTPRPYHHNQCGRWVQRDCLIGDLTSKCGPLESDASGEIRFFCTDAQLGATQQNFIDNIDDPRYPMVSLVIQDEMGGSILGCSCFEPVPPKAVRATMREPVWITINGRQRYVERIVDLYLYQSDPHDITYYRLYVNGLPEANNVDNVPYLQIRERAVPDNGSCDALGAVYEPRRHMTDQLPEVLNLIQTGDRDFIGELRRKIPLNSRVRRVATTSSWLPLFGRHTIIGRSVVLHNANGDVVDCATIEEVSASSDMRREVLSGYF